MNLFLKARHWQIFITFISLALFAQFSMLTMPSMLFSFIVPMLLVASLFSGWLWSISFAAYKQLPPELASSPKPMGIGLIFALLYLLTSNYIMGSHFGIGAILHLFAMAAIFYALGFTAKQLVKLQTNKDASFFNYLGTFFMFWFFPIGVWLIQPKVNNLLGAKNA